MNATADHDAAFGERAERCGNERAYRRKDNCGIEFFRRRLIGTAGPNRA